MRRELKKLRPVSPVVATTGDFNNSPTGLEGGNGFHVRRKANEGAVLDVGMEGIKKLASLFPPFLRE